MSIPGNELLSQIEEENPKLGIYLRNYLWPAAQRTAQNAAVDTTGQIQPPAPPHLVSVSTAGEMLQVTVNHNAPLIRGVHYIYHLATNPGFVNAQSEPKPATRAPFHFTAPTFKSDGVTKHSYYIAVQAQYPGGPPSAPTYYGGAQPLAVTLSGTTALDITPGTGSGTATNGGQTLVGLGKAPIRR